MRSVLIFSLPMNFPARLLKGMIMKYQTRQLVSNLSC